MKILTLTMLLKKIIKNISKEKKNIKIYGLATNSKKVKKGFIFFAIKGSKINGENFINDAIKKGAVAVVCSNKCKLDSKKAEIIKSPNVRQLLSLSCSRFYNSKPKNIFAVTGTNGKTSVADLFYQILNINKMAVASIGTLGTKYYKKNIKSPLTTPDAITLHQTLENLRRKKIDNVIIEASSHGLHQHRIDNLNLKAGIFTNFSQDHLDYHKTMTNYLNAKLILFKKILLKKKIIICNKSIEEFKNLKNIAKSRNLKLIDTENIKQKIKNILSKKYTEFQLNNISMAVAAAKLCGLSEKKIFNSLKKIKGVNGRLELIKYFPNNIKVYVDFAHTPDALLNSIKALKNSGKNISLVFGCGGDRDKKKRPIMAKIASLYCKKIYVTDDNPRNENPEKIRNDIIKNIKRKNYFNIGNRKKAIMTSIKNAEPNEIVLIAGKGHEDQQIYRNKTIFISDKKIIKNLKIKIKKKSQENQNFAQNKKIISEINNKIKVNDFHGLEIDSRKVKKKNIFLTIKGKKNDGNKFVSQAVQKGARYIVSSKNNKKYTNKIIKVSNEINFLNKFAYLKRVKSRAHIFAITGSAGKTSLKDLLKDLLQNFDKTYSSPKSYNNHFGVPLSLSQLKIDHKYGIFEVGMSRAGEINSLTKIIKPHVGIITNIGEAHIENFNNLSGIARAKGEIVNNIQKGGTLILNHDDKFFKFFYKKGKQKNLNIVSFGKTKGSDIKLTRLFKINGVSHLRINVKGQVVNLKIKNINIYNVLASFALMKVLNLNLLKVTKYFKNYEPIEGRGKIHKIKRYNKNFKLIDESYNANPLSVKNAIKNFNSIKKRKFKKYLLLGDMLELGKKSTKLHQDLSKVINNSDIDKVFIKGNKTLATYRKINKKKRGNIFQQDEDIDFTLNNIIANNDYLMIKGSNATGLNNLSRKIIKGI